MLADIAWSIGGFSLYLVGVEYDVAPWWAGWLLGVLAVLVPFAKWIIKEVLKAKEKRKKDKPTE